MIGPVCVDNTGGTYKGAAALGTAGGLLALQPIRPTSGTSSGKRFLRKKVRGAPGMRD
jgi:hypothetical protein